MDVRNPFFVVICVTDHHQKSIKYKFRSTGYIAKMSKNINLVKPLFYLIFDGQYYCPFFYGGFLMFQSDAGT